MNGNKPQVNRNWASRRFGAAVLEFRNLHPSAYEKAEKTPVSRS
jgi:hypothetical protein